MYYVYVLRSKKDNHFYVGYTSDLKERIEQHKKGAVESTQNRRPLQLIYYEASLNQKDAIHRENYLKSSYGKRYIKHRLKRYLNDANNSSNERSED